METTVNITDSQAIHKDANSINNEGHRKGIRFEEMVKHYSEWAASGDYDKDLGPEMYRGPIYAAEGLSEQVPVEKRSSYTILDIGAGTGFVGLQLSVRGFLHVDALEPAEGMLEQAMRRGVYRNLHCMGIGLDPVPISDDSYDALVCSGAMGEGHVPCRALTEFIRLVKPGGFVVIMMRERYLEEVEEYRDRLEPLMKKFAIAGAWSGIKRQVKKKYSFDNNGVLFVYRVNISGTLNINI